MFPRSGDIHSSLAKGRWLDKIIRDTLVLLTRKTFNMGINHFIYHSAVYCN